MRFKIFLFALTSLSFFASCSKENYYEDILTCESGANGLLLDKIEFLSEDGTKKLQEYVYDKTNQLEEINVKQKGEIVFFRKFMYDFQKRVVAEQRFSKTNGILQKSSVDSFVYDSKNRIIETKYFYIDTLKNLVLNHIAKYTYDKNDMLKSSLHLSRDYRDTINNNINDITRISKYYWDENNLVRQEDFSKTMTLEHEWTYRYDKKNNSSLKVAPFYPPFKFQNTQISFSVIDHTGLLDLFIRSKITMLCYNTDGFLTKVVREKGEETYFYRNLK